MKKLFLKNLIVLLYVISSFTICSFADSLDNISPSKDTFLDQKYPTSIFGLGWKLDLGSWDSSTAQAVLLQYDVSAIPSNATVANAYVSFKKNTTTWTSTSIALQIRRNTSSWAENSATWNTINPNGLTIVGSTTINPTLSYPIINSPSALVTLVQEWVQNSATNYGVLLLPGIADANYIRFYAKENTDGMSPPLLSVTYTVPIIETVDLTPSTLTVSDSTVDPGQSINATWFITKSGTLAANNFYHGVYWSTDTTITTGDTQLKENGPSTIISSGTGLGATSTVTIPSGATPGQTYYIGYLVDSTSVVSETNEGNNTRFVAVTVNTPPSTVDLTPSTLTVSDSTVDPGQSINATWFITKSGTLAANNFYHGVYWSTDTTITTGDTQLKENGPSTIISSGTGLGATSTVTIPSGATPGQTYYIGYLVDSTNVVSETNEGNNTRYVAVTISSVDTVDLTPSTLTVSDSSVDPGQSINATWFITKSGTLAANNFYHGVYWSTDTTITTGDTQLKENGPSTIISSGTGLGATSTVTIPSGATPGQTYYIGYLVDSTSVVSETNEGNNTRYVAVTVNTQTQPIPFSENFSSASLPSSWTTQNDGVSERWSVSATTWAGGVAYEMMCHYLCVDPATTRLVTPPLNTVGYSSLTLSFKHMLDDYGPGATLKIQTSTNGSSWTDEAWSLATVSNTNIGPATINTQITHNLNSSTTYVAFVITGNLCQFDNWYIDNISVTDSPPPPDDYTNLYIFHGHDFNGDGASDAGVYRPANSFWYIKGVDNYLWGSSGDKPASGDYDGDGKTDVAVFRASAGKWFIRRSSNGTTMSKVWGSGGDVAVPGDYDGDGKTDVAVWRPAIGKWYILGSAGTNLFIAWGVNADIPVPGDYDGDGKTDLAVFRPATNKWYIRRSSNGASLSYTWGANDDITVPADYDGDGLTDVAVFRPAQGKWIIRRSSNGTTLSYTWGESSDTPAPGDFDKDGKADVAVFRPTAGKWIIRNSSNGSTVSYLWGTNGDVPLVK